MPCRFASSGTVATSRSASRAILALNTASNFLRDLVISVLHRLRQSRTLHTLTFGPISGVHFTGTSTGPPVRRLRDYIAWPTWPACKAPREERRCQSWRCVSPDRWMFPTDAAAGSSPHRRPLRHSSAAHPDQRRCGSGLLKGEEILACEQAGVAVTRPKPQTSGAKSAGRFGKPDFVYLT